MKLLGAVPSPHDARDDLHAFQTSELFVGSASPARVTIDVSDVHTWRVQPANNCVTVSIVSQAQDLATAQGDPVELLGPMPLYARNRILGAPPVAGIGLPDIGSSCRLGYKVARDYGILSENDWPNVAENATRVPPSRVWSAPPVVKLDTFRRIHGELDVDTLRTGIIAALTFAKDGRCSLPTACIPVDDAYGELDESAVYDAAGGAYWGFHCQIIVAYDAARDAAAFASSWGRRLYWVSLGWLAANGFEFWLFESLNRMPTMPKVAA